MLTLGQTEIRFSLAVIKLFFAIFAFLAVNYPLHAATAAPTIRAAIAVTDHPKAATANPKDFYDNRFLQELETSGFVKELYASR